MVFGDTKYSEASEKALEFIKNQLNVNDFKFEAKFSKEYDSDFSGDVLWGTVEGLTNDYDQVSPKYIGVESYYDYDYTGKVEGTWSALPDNDTDYTKYAVNVYVIRDSAYKIISCPLKEDGTWESAIKYRETYSVDGSVNEYYVSENVTEGIKEFRLSKNAESSWEEVSSSDEMSVERLVYTADDEISAADGGFAYRYFSYFTVRLYSYSDTEYLNDSVNIYNVGGGKYIWYSNKAGKGKKIGKVIQKVWRDGAFNYDVVGIAGASENIKKGRLPASFKIPSDDPQYDKDGSTANGVHGYLLNSRTWAYDVGLSLLVFSTSGDYDICKEMLERMKYEQNEDGSFNFSYDIYIGQLFEDYVRTGAVGWLIWGMCYYTIKSGDRSYADVIKKGGEWLLSRQITDTNDLRYGLLTGGYGSYDSDYTYKDEEITWCAVEHNCSALQAILGCALVLNDTKYTDSAELIKENLYKKCYDISNKRFYQGISDSLDKAWALDCTTWAGSILLCALNAENAENCLDTAKSAFYTKNKSIIKSTDKSYYNNTYESENTFSGFKPYSDKTTDYANCPDIIWTEGTLGYAALAYSLGKYDEAKTFVDECIKIQNCTNSSGGILYVTATYADLPWEFHAWESLVSSAWLYLLINNPDVLFPKMLKKVYFTVKGGTKK